MFPAYIWIGETFTHQGLLLMILLKYFHSVLACSILTAKYTEGLSSWIWNKAGTV